MSKADGTASTTFTPTSFTVTPPVRDLVVAEYAGKFVVGATDGDGASTLRRITETGTISLGHRESSVPFSYYDSRKQVVGYSHDLMLRVVEAIKARLALPALTIRLVPVTPGLFDDGLGLVQVSGSGLAAGQRVVVPGS